MSRPIRNLDECNRMLESASRGRGLMIFLIVLFLGFAIAFLVCWLMKVPSGLPDNHEPKICMWPGQTPGNCAECKEGYLGQSILGGTDCTECAPGYGKDLGMDPDPRRIPCVKCEDGYQGNNCEQCANGYTQLADGRCVQETVPP
jgi:hypothetical protein